jgi:hypothetical protein
MIGVASSSGYAIGESGTPLGLRSKVFAMTILPDGLTKPLILVVSRFDGGH